MITLEINEKDLKRVQDRFAKMPAVIAQKLQNLVEYATFGIERDSKTAVTTGETRAFDTGNLFKSITSNVGHLEGYVVANAPYAVYVHEGTRYMRERPFMEAGIKKFTPSWNTYLKSILNDL